MEIAAADLRPEAAYKLITGVVVPRPIAWITTLSPEARVNLAPFSAFTFVCTHPPMIGVNIGRKASGVKDTAANIHARGEFVVNIADESMVEAVHASAVEHPPEVSEADLLGLATVPSRAIGTPRLAMTPVGLECRFERAIAFGPSGAEFIVGEVLVFHIRDAILDHGKVDTAKLKPLCRLGGPRYARLGEIVTVAKQPGASKPIPTDAV